MQKGSVSTGLPMVGSDLWDDVMGGFFGGNCGTALMTRQMEQN